MKTAIVADLRNKFHLVSSWLEYGETIHIINRRRAFAQLTATPPSQPTPVPKVDFMAQLKEIWGDRVFSEEEVQALRDAEQEGY